MSMDVMNEIGFLHAHTKRQEVDNIPAGTIINTDYSDDLVLLANIPAQVESVLYSLDQATRSIGLNAKPDKKEFMCFN